MNTSANDVQPADGAHAGAVYRYCIDAQDRITEVSENWDAFARANAAASNTLAGAVVGRPLWSFIAGEETEHLFRLIAAHVRKSGATLTIPIRCDSPDCRRCLSLSLRGLPDDEMVFESRVDRIEMRAPIDMLDARFDRSAELMRICSFCKKIASREDEWIEIEAAVRQFRLFEATRLPMLTHGVCPVCYLDMLTAADLR